ncbi:hypothetical protein Ancab_019652 [Ancistrocladus abbreviatus]
MYDAGLFGPLADDSNDGDEKGHTLEELQGMLRTMMIAAADESFNDPLSSHTCRRYLFTNFNNPTAAAATPPPPLPPPLPLPPLPPSHHHHFLTLQSRALRCEPTPSPISWAPADTNVKCRQIQWGMRLWICMWVWMVESGAIAESLVAMAESRKKKKEKTSEGERKGEVGVNYSRGVKNEREWEKAYAV